MVSTISDEEFKIADGVITESRELAAEKQQHAGYSGLAPSDGT